MLFLDLALNFLIYNIIQEWFIYKRKCPSCRKISSRERKEKKNKNEKKKWTCGQHDDSAVGFRTECIADFAI